MATFYGVKPSEKATSVGTPATVSSGITIAFGTAPIHQVGGKANEIITVNSFSEAVSAIGWSDDWDKYTLCEVIYSHFKLYGISPLKLVNVLVPEDHKKEVTEEIVAISNGKITLTGDTLEDTIVVKNNNKAYTAGEDYAVFYEDGNCYVEVLAGGAMETDKVTAATVSYSMVDFTLDDVKTNVIGGTDAKTGAATGLELMDKSYFKDRVLPDIIIAPGFSQDAAVAAAMAAKAQSFSTVFKATAICDLDSSKATNCQEAEEIKEGNAAYRQLNQLICWPLLGNGELTFHYSTQLAGLIGSTDADHDDVPSEPISNKTLQADCAKLADGTEILLDISQANDLRGHGIVTALNFVNGFTSWGAYNACYPANTDPKDCYTNVSRMFTYVCNSVVLRYWSQIDQKLTPRLAASIVDELNYWLNGLVNSGHLLGARCELKSEENSTEDLMAGIIRVHVYMTPAGPAQEIDFIAEYDASYVESVLGSIMA